MTAASSARSVPPARAAVLLVVAAALVLAAVASAGSGAVPLSPAQVVAAALGGDQALIVQQYRLPRIGVAALAGAALAVAGALLQGAVRNPLASPDVVGVTKGAGLGAMIATVVAPSTLLHVAVPVGVIAGALLVTGLLLGVARLVGSRGASLALVGVAVAALAAAGVESLMVLFPAHADQAVVWLVGSVHGSGPDDVAFLVAWLSCCLPLVALCTARLDLAGFDDDSQSGLGASTEANRALLVSASVALTAGAVNAAGGIGFLGLLTPHLARLLVGARPRWALPTAALLGALLLVLADAVGRVVALPNEIPAGIVAAVVGGPFLLIALLREGRRHG